MKIVRVDNFDRDTVCDKLVAENVNDVYGTCMVEALNAEFSGDSLPDYFRMVPDDYVLKEWEP